MTRISIFYKNEPGKFFDENYYLQKHIPLSKKLQGSSLKQLQVEIGIAGVPQGTSAKYIAIAHCDYNSMDDFIRGFMPHRQQLEADIKNYTDIEPHIQISELKHQS